MKLEEALKVTEWHKKHDGLQTLRMCPNIDDLLRYAEALEIHLEHLQEIIKWQQRVQTEMAGNPNPPSQTLP